MTATAFAAASLGKNLRPSQPHVYYNESRLFDGSKKILKLREFSQSMFTQTVIARFAVGSTASLYRSGSMQTFRRYGSTIYRIHHLFAGP